MMKEYYVVTELVSEQERFNEPYKIDLTDEEFDIFEEFAYLDDPGFVGIQEATFNDTDKADVSMFGNLIDRTTLQVRVAERIMNLNEEIKRLEEMMEKLNK